MHPKRTPGTCFPGRGRPAPPRISVTVPEEVSQQEDLLVARSSELGGNSNTAVALTFNHALTAVRFVCGNDMREGTIWGHKPGAVWILPPPSNRHWIK